MLKLRQKKNRALHLSLHWWNIAFPMTPEIKLAPEEIQLAPESLL